MAQYLRTIEVPVQHQKQVVRALMLKHYKLDIRHAYDSNGILSIITFHSDMPYLFIPAPVVVERNSSEAEMLQAIQKQSFMSNAGVITPTLAQVVSTTVGTYDATATLTDNSGTSATVAFKVRVVDSIAPVIEGVENETIYYGDIAAWEIPATLEATDNEDDDITEDIVTTFYQSNGTTTVADLAAFRTYLTNSGEGGIRGHIKFTVADEEGHTAELWITVTANPRAVITAPAEIDLAFEEIAEWDNDSMSALNGDLEDETANVVITYFEADGSTPITNLADFRTYLNNTGSGEAVGVVKYALTVTDDSVAVAKQTIVTSLAPVTP